MLGRRGRGDTLSDEDMGGRITEWQAVLAHVRDRAPMDGGVRLTLGVDADLAEVTRVARAESACCSFDSGALTSSAVPRPSTVSEKAARELVTSVFGVAAGSSTAGISPSPTPACIRVPREAATEGDSRSRTDPHGDFRDGNIDRIVISMTIAIGRTPSRGRSGRRTYTTGLSFEGR